MIFLNDLKPVQTKFVVIMQLYRCDAASRDCSPAAHLDLPDMATLSGVLDWSNRDPSPSGIVRASGFIGIGAHRRDGRERISRCVA
jgi:hypothetical protein